MRNAKCQLTFKNKKDVLIFLHELDVLFLAHLYELLMLFASPLASCLAPLSVCYCKYGGITYNVECLCKQYLSNLGACSPHYLCRDKPKQGNCEYIFQISSGEMISGYEADSPEITHNLEVLYLFDIISHHTGHNIEMGCGLSFSKDLRPAI